MKKFTNKYFVVLLIFILGISMGNVIPKDDLDESVDEFYEEPTDVNTQYPLYEIKDNVFTRVARDGEKVVKGTTKFVVDAVGKIIEVFFAL